MSELPPSDPKPFNKGQGRIVDWDNVLKTKVEKGWSLNQTSKFFGINKSTLADRVRKEKKVQVHAAAHDVSVDWESIRQSRIKDGLTFAELEQKFGVTSAAISLRAMEESWPTPAAYEQHSIIKKANGMGEKALDLMNAWRKVNIGKLLDNYEAYAKLQPLDPDTASDDELARRTRILRIIQQEEALLSTHIGRGSKLWEMEMQQNAPITNPLTINLSDLGKYVNGPKYGGILDGDDVVVDVTTEAREKEKAVTESLVKSD